MEKKMKLDDGVREAVEAIQVSATMPPEMARNYLEMLGHAATKIMRAKFGVEYTRGYLEAALAELDQPPMIELRKPQ
jgi:hypothetical protein